MEIITQLSMWDLYFENFLMHPWLMSVLFASLIISMASFLAFKRTIDIRTKTSFLYSHIFFLFSPFIFATLLWGCVIPIYHCMPKMIIYGISGVSAISLVAGFIAIPYLYPWATNSKEMNNSKMNSFLKKHTKRLKIRQPRLYSLGDITPKAYSITNVKPAMFLSTALCCILNNKEMEAVLLHELYHIKNKSSFWKFSIKQIKMFSPLSSFSSIEKSLDMEEKAADLFAIKSQGTDRFLHSAKYKINKVNKD